MATRVATPGALTRRDLVGSLLATYPTVRHALWILAVFVACAAPADDELDEYGGKDDRGTSPRFYEVDTTHTNATFRTYIHRALDELAATDGALARETLASIRAGRVRID